MNSMQEWVMSPFGQTILIAVGGWMMKVVYDVVIAVVRAKGKSDLQKAEAALSAAVKTDAAQDDAVAKMALERAKNSQSFLSALAEELEKHRPGTAPVAPAAPAAPER